MSKSSSKPDAWPHPANFPIGSPESRAAARALADERNRVDERFVLRVKFIGGSDLPAKRDSYRFVNNERKTVEWVIIRPDCSTLEYRVYRARVGLGNPMRNCEDKN